MIGNCNWGYKVTCNLTNLKKRVFLLCHLPKMPCKSHKATAWDFQFAQPVFKKLPDVENDQGRDATLPAASLIPDSGSTSRSTWPENERYCTLHIVAHVQCVHYVHRRSWKYATHPHPTPCHHLTPIKCTLPFCELDHETPNTLVLLGPLPHSSFSREEGWVIW